MTEDACIICGAKAGPVSVSVCVNCIDDWGAVQRVVERWQRAKSAEGVLRHQVAAVVVYLCDEKGLSETQAAKAIGVSRLTIRAWRGK